MATRASFEGILIRRQGAALAFAGLDGESHDGANEDLNDPLGCALRKLGYSVSDVGNVTDADLAQVQEDQIDAFLDLAELRTLETILQAASTLVDVTTGPRREAFGQFAQRLERQAEKKRERIEREYGWLAGGGLEAGVIGLDFAEHGNSGE